MDLRTRLRLGLLVVIPVAYVSLIGFGIVTGASGFALAHALFGGVLLVAATLAASPLDVGPDLLWPATGGYFLAGLAFGYSGLVGLAFVPTVTGSRYAGDLALLIAFAAFLYQREGSRQSTADS